MPCYTVQLPEVTMYVFCLPWKMKMQRLSNKDNFLRERELAEIPCELFLFFFLTLFLSLSGSLTQIFSCFDWNSPPILGLAPLYGSYLEKENGRDKCYPGG